MGRKSQNRTDDENMNSYRVIQPMQGEGMYAVIVSDANFNRFLFLFRESVIMHMTSAEVEQHLMTSCLSRIFKALITV